MRSAVKDLVDADRDDAPAASEYDAWSDLEADDFPSLVDEDES